MVWMGYNRDRTIWAANYGVLFKLNNETLICFKRYITDEASGNQDFFKVEYIDKPADSSDRRMDITRCSVNWNNTTNRLYIGRVYQIRAVVE
jgi:hypothetical protein